jgi:hypothetical protein
MLVLDWMDIVMDKWNIILGESVIVRLKCLAASSLSLAVFFLAHEDKLPLNDRWKMVCEFLALAVIALNDPAASVLKERK